MAITRLQNIFTSKTGRILYVNPDDFDASDLISNRGNSPLRPFKTLQRALLEVSKFSYVPGDAGQNDRFDQFTIMLYPGEHIIDNRPGLSSNSVNVLTDSSNFNIQDANNDLYKFNSVRGGVIVPRGASIVGMDLRKTKIIPKFIPDPSQSNTNLIKSNYPITGITNSGSFVIDDDSRSAIFRITGSCYFWQFSIFDGDTEVYKANPRTNLIGTSINWNSPSVKVSGSAALFSRHKLTAFEYACRADLNLYYQKINTAFGIPSVDPVAQRSEETRIVGPGGQSSDTIRIGSLSYEVNGSNYLVTAKTIQPTSNNPLAHEFSVGNLVRIYNESNLTSPYFGGPFRVDSITSSVAGGTIDQFSYIINSEPNGSISGTGNTKLYCELETDTVDSASPYIFNISLRSTYGLCGMHANGAFADGFKSMVVAQFTGISLQRDNEAYARFCNQLWTTGNSCNGVLYQKPAQQDINSRYRSAWETYHIKASNNGYIQVVSCFAIGYSNQFLVESGADMSIANSNSSFGSNALTSRGYRNTAFLKDTFGKITHVIPPKSLPTTPEKINYLPLDLQKTGTNNTTNNRLYLYGYTNQNVKPPIKVLGYTIGGKTNDTISVVINGTIRTATITPSGSSVKSLEAGATGSPLQWDSTKSNWYLNVTNGSTIVNAIGTNATGPSNIAYIERIPDNRTLNDKIYRLRLQIEPSSQAAAPETGFVIQKYNSGNGVVTPYPNTFYIFNVEEKQKISTGTTGIYYLTALRGDISFNNGQITNKLFSQNINYLYPQIDIDNPVSDPNAATSTVDLETIGLVVSDPTASITKEAIYGSLTGTGSTYGFLDVRNANQTSVAAGAGSGDEETRKRAIGTGISVELRRPSIIRAGNHTFEYTGYGPGNYSTAFPSRQSEILSDNQILYSQSTQENGGISFYSGLNSKGDLYIGNIVIDPVTGTSRTVNNPTSSDDENNPIYDALTVKNTINVIGGADNNQTSLFYGPIAVNKQIRINGDLDINSIYSIDSTNGFTGINVNVSGAPTGTNILNIKSEGTSKLLLDKDGNLTITGSLIGAGISSTIKNYFGAASGNRGTGLVYSSTTGTFTYGIPTPSDIFSSTQYNTISIPLTLSSTSTTALRVNGGVSIGSGNTIITLSNGAISTRSLSVSGLSFSTGISTGYLRLNTTTTIGEGDIGSSGGSDGIFGIYNTSTSGSITFNTENQAGTSQTRLTINSTSITAGSGVSFVGNGTIPVGGIIMWSGTIAQAVAMQPSWALCDGRIVNGITTPDLRDRFIVGAGSNYSVGSTGGANSVTLTTDQIPSHTHTISPANVLSQIDDGPTKLASSPSGTPLSYEVATELSSIGGGQAHENRPPYYALAFIMRTA